MEIATLEARYVDACQSHGSSPNNLILSAFVKAKLLKSLDEACILEIIIDQLTDTDISSLTEALFLVKYSELDAVDILYISPCVVFNGQDLLALMRSIGPKLRVVDLKDISLGKDSLRDLLERGLPCQLLNLSSCCVRKLNMSGHFFALHTLKLDFNNLTSLPKDCFIFMPKLKRLSMCETGITNFWTTCAALSRLPSLLELRFQNCLCCNDTGKCPQSSSEKLNSLVHESIALKPAHKDSSTDWPPVDRGGVRFPDSELSETDANFHDMFSDDESVARYHLGHSSNDNSSDESDTDSRFHLRELVGADIPTNIQQQTGFLRNLKRQRNEIAHMDYNNANVWEQPTEHKNAEESFFETNEWFSLRNEELFFMRDRETHGSLSEASHNPFDCRISTNTFYSAPERTIPGGLSAINSGEGTSGNDLNVAFPEMPVSIAVRRDASYHPSPICFEKHYREFIIASLPGLKVLDNVPISQLERERAQKTFSQHFELLPYNRRDKENVINILNGRETGICPGLQKSSKLKQFGMASGNAVSFHKSICAAKMAAWPDIHPISKSKKCLNEINNKFRPRQFEYHPKDSSLMVFGTLDGEVVVINHESGKLVGHAQSVEANRSVLGLCWFSKDPTKLIAGSDNGTLQLYDVNRMRSALVPGRYGANSSNRNPSSYTYEEFESLTSVHINSTDDYFLASGYSKHVALYDICSGRRLHVFEDLHGEHINVVKFSHHSPNIFATSSFDKDIKMWDLRQKPTHPLYTNTSTRGNVMVCFSHDDHYILSSAVDNEVKQHLAVDGRLHTKFDIASTGGVQNYTRSYYMNGKDYIISGSCEENVVRICCAQTGRRLRDLALEGRGSRSSLYVQSLRGDPFRVAETRFASNTIVLRRLIKVKDALTRMVTSANWTVWRQSNSDRATTIRGLILNESWWDRAEYLLKITEPILSMIRYTDMDRPCLGEVYDGIDSMIEDIRNIVNEKEQDLDEKFFKELQLIMIERWNKMTTPLHLLAFALSPRFYSQSVLKGSTTRVPPYRDPEVAQGYKAALRRLFPEHLRPAVRAEFMSFASTDDCGIEALEDKNNANAHKWWFYHGEKYQHLQPIAIKILSQDFHLSVLAAYFNPDSKSEILKINFLSSDICPKDHDSDLQCLSLSGMGG